MKIFKRLLISWKLFRLLSHLITGLILALLFLHKGIHASAFISRLYIWWNQFICRLFHARITIKGEINNSPTLFLVNHISWFDIPVLGAQKPLHFLSKAEVRHWPLIGWLAHKAGTLFIWRGAPGAAQKSLDEITQCLEQGHSVVIFPEGTTSDGSSLRQFHGRLLQAAIDAQVRIQPVALRYPDKDGINTHVPYIDDMSFMDSLIGLTYSPTLQVELHFLKPVDSHIGTQTITRKQLAEEARQAIAAALNIKL